MAPTKTTWSSGDRVDITFSLSDSIAGQHARDLALQAIEDLGGGWTCREGLGGWAGNTEVSYTITLVGVQTHDTKARAAVDVLFASGCEAIQVESWYGGGVGGSQGYYRCEEWRVDK